MKHTKIFAVGVATVAVFAGSSSAAITDYFSDFSSGQGYLLGDLNGQNGWTVNSATADVGFIQSASGPWGGRAASIGYASPVSTSSLYVSQGTDAAIVGGATATSFSALFQVVDSDSGFGSGSEARDKFGFRLENAANQNIFSFQLNPFSQVAQPELVATTNTFTWSSDFANGGAPTVALPGNAAAEDFAYTFSLSFFDAGSGDVGFNASVNGVGFTGTLDAASAQTITEFGATWNTLDTTGTIEPGSNFMLFDNVTFIPEPSSALLGILGASCAFLRRRRA